MTDAEQKLVEAAIAYRKWFGPKNIGTSLPTANLIVCAETVIAERNFISIEDRQLKEEENKMSIGCSCAVCREIREQGRQEILKQPIIQENQKYWIVVNFTRPLRQFPFKHDSHISARTQAIRLAEQHSDELFEVLEFVGSAKKNQTIWQKAKK